jgi:hypothetical protein
MRRSATRSFFLGLGLILVLAACNSSGGYQDGLGLTSVSGTGFLQVHLTDKPIDLNTVESVMVTIDEVKVYPADEQSCDDVCDCDDPDCDDPDCDDPDTTDDVCDDPDCDDHFEADGVCDDPDCEDSGMTGTIDDEICDDPDCDDHFEADGICDDPDCGDDPDLCPDGCPDGPVVIMDHPETFDLLTLTDGATELLAEAGLPACDYSRIRLGVANAQLIFKDETMEELKIESHKIDIPIPFTITADEMMSIVLDFEADGSVKVNETGNGKYILRPVVTPVMIGS